MKTTVLVASYHPGGAQAILPVVQALMKKYYPNVSVYTHGKAHDVFTSARITHCNLESFSQDSIADRIYAEEPDVILLGSSLEPTSLEKVIVRANKGLRVPTVGVMDMYGEHREKWPVDAEPDYIAVMDELQRQEMIREGFDVEKLIVTGQPAFDQLLRLSAEYKLPPEKSVLFTTQPITPSSEYDNHFLSRGITMNLVLQKLLDALPTDFNLLLRIHPRQVEEEKAEMKRILSAYPHSSIDTESNGNNSILRTDTTSSMFSTMLVYAMHLGRPGVSIQPGMTPEQDMLPTNRLGSTVPVYDLDKLKSTLEQVLCDEDFRAGLREKWKQHENDGRATERVVQLVERFLPD